MILARRTTDETDYFLLGDYTARLGPLGAQTAAAPGR